MLAEIFYIDKSLPNHLNKPFNFPLSQAEISILENISEELAEPGRLYFYTTGYVHYFEFQKGEKIVIWGSRRTSQDNKEYFENLIKDTYIDWVRLQLCTETFDYREKIKKDADFFFGLSMMFSPSQRILFEKNFRKFSETSAF